MPGDLAFSSLELDALSAKVESELRSYYVNNVYSISEDALAIKMHRAEAEEKSVVLSCRLGVWCTNLPLPRTEVTDFARKLRELFVRKQLVSCRVPEGERVVRLEFGDREGILRCYVEVFGGGNIIATDQEETILSSLKDVSRKRSLKVGDRYLLPPSRGVPVSALTPSDLMKAAPKDDGVVAERKTSFALPGRILEEATYRVRTNRPRIAEESQDFASAVLEELKRIQEEARNASHFYVYSEDGSEILSAIRFTHLAAPFEEFDWERLELRLSKELEKYAARGSSSALLAQLKKEQNRIENAKITLLKTKERVEALNELASKLQSGAVDIESMTQKINSVSNHIRRGGSGWSYKGRKTEFSSPFTLASKLFDEAKDLKGSMESIKESISRMEANLQRMKREAETEKEMKLAPHRGVRRNRVWFEAYRWFVTSDGFLAVGGRDAGSNSLLIRRRLESSDLVFHTEAAGSPFFILKRGKECSDEGLRQVAQATVSYSRAWRDGLTAADAYCVSPEQVQLGAPSGTFMPKGSFMIVGERRYFKGVKLQLGVGLTILGGGVAVCSGPVDPLMRYCSIIVEIVPGHLPPGAIAKKLLNIFAGHSDVNADGISPDEIVRSLPPGKASTGRILKGEGKPFKEDLW